MTFFYEGMQTRFRQIVWHLPMEISRITKFIVDRGAKCTLKIRVTHYRRSPLVQGGLEVPCEVSITMIGSVVNHVFWTRYESLLKELYMEPKGEKIVGTFLSLARHANEIGEIAEAEPRPRQCKSLRRTGLVINFICLFYVSQDKSKESG